MQDVAVDYLQSLIASMLIPFNIFCISGSCTTFTSNTITFEIFLPKTSHIFCSSNQPAFLIPCSCIMLHPTVVRSPFVPGYQLYTTRFSHSLPGETTRARTRVMAGAHGAGGVFGSV